MSNRITLSPRDRALLRVLSWTPATTALLLDASVSFEGGSFLDDRRLRERLSALAREDLVRSWSAATVGGGLQNYYKLTSTGFAVLFGQDAKVPPRSFFAEVAPSAFHHTFRLAEVIVTLIRSCHDARITIDRIFRENELTLEIGEDRLQPDCFVRLACAGRTFNFAFEIDTGHESVDSPAKNSIRRKLKLYHAYQEQSLASWTAAGRQWEPPRFRAVFLTESVARTYHILALAELLQRHRTRRLVYAAPQSSFTSHSEALQAPHFLDHFGHWQALVNLHPTASFLKSPVRIGRPVESPFAA